ncbi:MAG: family 1 encapsulin nanocompartment shell protein [Muricomes sp.]
MSYLSREAAPFSEGLWEKIDATIIKTARHSLVGRRFLHVLGPLGVGVQSVPIDDADVIEEVEKDGLITTSGRRFAEIPLIYEDFTLLARDLESAKKSGFPVDLSKAAQAAEACALKEDNLIFWGSKDAGYTGLLTTPGAQKVEKKDWNIGENAFTDITAGIIALSGKGFYGTYSLLLSLDLYMQLQRIQPGTGLLEIERISKLVNNHIYPARALGPGKAVLAASDEMNMDLVIGQDMAAAYLEQKDLNHSIRILETVVPRFKRKEAIVIFE